METKKVIATILHYANELDNSGYIEEADRLTKIAEEFDEFTNLPDKKFDPYSVGEKSPMKWLTKEEQDTPIDFDGLDPFAEPYKGDEGDLFDAQNPDEEVPAGDAFSD